MNMEFHKGNRETMYKSLKPGSVAVVYSGHVPRRTGDEEYPAFVKRNFLYLTGIEQQDTILMAAKLGDETKETLFVLPSDLRAERWNGKRLTLKEASEISGIEDIKYIGQFKECFDKIISSYKYENVYLDFDKYKSDEPDNEAYKLAAYIKSTYPYICLKNLNPQLRKQRTIKQPCEIEALRMAEKITREGIIAMMQKCKPGMFEYQLKAEFEYALAQHGVIPGFPPIVSSGNNNFCIHYYSYRGQIQDGDFILNDVGASWNNMINDVSRGWPVNGKFSEKQALLYNCAYETSNYMFRTLKPGIPMADVDLMVRKYNFERLKSIGLCDNYDEVGKYIWHGGAHHVGLDVHDEVDMTMPLTPGMVFCVDVGIYVEEWGIGFRLEDNCLITETGCENLSAIIPRSIEEIEAVMGKR